MKATAEDGILEFPGDYDRHIPEVLLPEYVLEKIAVYGKEIACANAENGQQLTYEDIGHITRHLAAGFTCKWNLRTGAKVAIVLPSCLQYPLTVMAANLCGATAVLVNPAQTTFEFQHVIKLTNPEFWIATESFLPKYYELYGSDAPLSNVILLGNGDQSSVATWNDVVQLGAKQPPDLTFRSPEVDPKQLIAMILFSSGTTGVPKGVALTHYNLVACRCQSLEMIKNYPRMPDNKSVMLLPQYHVLGLSSIFDSLIRGLFFVLVPKFSLRILLQAIQDYKITIITLVPAIAVQLAKQPVEKKYDLSSIRVIAVGAAPIGKEIIERLAEKFSCFVLQGYGMTESSMRTHGNTLTDNRFGSIGITLPFCQTKVMDPETGRSLGPNQNGEICVRGPIVMKGYFGDEKSTSSTIDADGWLHTGDIGHYDDDGFFYITDRMKELIKYKGLQVAPSELEHVLLTHPDVVDAAVVGIPDEDSGELPRAYVIKRSNSSLTARQVAKFVEGLVSPHKKLRGGIVFVKEIPRTKTGKIIRRQLIALASKL